MDNKVPNKLASIFVTGGLAMVLIALFNGKEAFDGFVKPTALDILKNGSASLPLLLSAFLLAVATGAVALIGASIQGIGHLVRLGLQQLMVSQRFCLLLFNGPARNEITAWNRLYTELSKASWSTSRKKAFGRIYKLGRKSPPFEATAHPIVPRQCVAIFFRYAGGGHLSWVLQHYATYYLTTDTLAAVLVTGALSGYCPALLVDLGLISTESTTLIVWYVILTLSLVMLVVVSMHRYLYTYNAVIRYCCALMSHPSPYFPDQLPENENGGPRMGAELRFLFEGRSSHTTGNVAISKLAGAMAVAPEDLRTGGTHPTTGCIHHGVAHDIPRDGCASVGGPLV